MSLTQFAIDTDTIQRQFEATLLPASLLAYDGLALWLDQSGATRRLAVLAAPTDPRLDRFTGLTEGMADSHVIQWCPLTHANARALRETLPWLKPALLGLATSAGFGDRLGLATPGHIRALNSVLADRPHRPIAPIFAQQSIREMTRTRRTPNDVLTDATWGAFEGGWRGVLGADADHLKTTADVDACVAAGFSFYTFDPGAYVDSEVDEAAPSEVEHKLEALPWAQLESSPADLMRQYVGQRVRLEHLDLMLDATVVARAAAKYGAAIAHVVSLYRHLDATGAPYEVEVSVDETETPTSHAEHFYIASELSRLGVTWVSLAPRYVGRFEKGVDYIGDLAALQADLEGHAAIARGLGPYKLSLHSGSDKFSVYPLINAAARGQVHLKTAGTSYLEALRVLTHVDTEFFREILTLARERYDEDKASYHISAEVARVPASADLADAQLPSLLEDFDAREVLHVTFGSVLAHYEDRLKASLRAHADVYAATLERHFIRHLEPFG